MDTQIKSIDDHLIDGILSREGATFTDDPLDHGGATKFGITQRAWMSYLQQHVRPGTPLPAHVAEITEPMAREFYRVMYVAPLAWIDDVLVRELVIDSSINCGATRAVKWLQRAANCVAIDGIIGPETRKRVNATMPAALMDALFAQRMDHYIDICVREPAQLRFLKGWWHRLREFIQWDC